MNRFITYKVYVIIESLHPLRVFMNEKALVKIRQDPFFISSKVMETF